MTTRTRTRAKAATALLAALAATACLGASASAGQVGHWTQITHAHNGATSNLGLARAEERRAARSLGRADSPSVHGHLRHADLARRRRREAAGGRLRLGQRPTPCCGDRSGRLDPRLDQRVRRCSPPQIPMPV